MSSRGSELRNAVAKARTEARLAKSRAMKIISLFPLSCGGHRLVCHHANSLFFFLSRPQILSLPPNINIGPKGINVVEKRVDLNPDVAS